MGRPPCLQNPESNLPPLGGAFGEETCAAHARRAAPGRAVSSDLPVDRTTVALGGLGPGRLTPACRAPATLLRIRDSKARQMHGQALIHLGVNDSIP
jgi:hypothetical protein